MIGDIINAAGGFCGAFIHATRNTGAIKTDQRSGTAYCRSPFKAAVVVVVATLMIAGGINAGNGIGIAFICTSSDTGTIQTHCAGVTGHIWTPIKAAIIIVVATFVIGTAIDASNGTGGTFILTTGNAGTIGTDRSSCTGKIRSPFKAFVIVMVAALMIGRIRYTTDSTRLTFICTISGAGTVKTHCSNLAGYVWSPFETFIVIIIAALVIGVIVDAGFFSVCAFIHAAFNTSTTGARKVCRTCSGITPFQATVIIELSTFFIGSAVHTADFSGSAFIGTAINAYAVATYEIGFARLSCAPIQTTVIIIFTARGVVGSVDAFCFTGGTIIDAAQDADTG